MLRTPDLDPRQRQFVTLSERDGEIAGDSTRAFVIVPHLPGGAGTNRTPTARREEAVGLALAIDLFIVDSRVVSLRQIRPATLIGKGKVEEIAGLLSAYNVGLVVVDASLSPVQQRNLEKAWKAKVIDRTGLILEIFGRRARTREGTLQVELAHLTYQKSRLVRSWTHLERQRGGFGFLGGPGETQIEADRRLIQERIARIEADLKDVTRTRRLHRAGRKRVPYPIVALVGYTNAGKSTLFNALTAGSVLAKDMLFATLDPTLREMRLPFGRRTILSDTVGFISDLPTMLVAAFRATLEEVIEADVILHVRDVSHPDAAAQAEDVRSILSDLGIATESDRLIEVWNKIDRLTPDERERLETVASRDETAPIAVSALTGEGLDRLKDAVDRRIGAALDSVDLTISGHDGATLAWLHDNGDVLARHVHDNGDVSLTVRLAADKRAILDRRLAARSLDGTGQGTKRG